MSRVVVNSFRLEYATSSSIATWKQFAGFVKVIPDGDILPSRSKYNLDTNTTVEINSSYYGPPLPGTARKWVSSVSHNKDFRFTVKLFHSFTHERKPAPGDERDFKAGIAPLAEADKLGAILIQFPWSFKNEPPNREYLWQLQARFSEYPLVGEVRHASWITDEVLDTFAALGIGFCNIDQRSSIAL